MIPSNLGNVMYYIPSPDLSGGVEKNVPELQERSDVETAEVVYSRPSLEQDEYFRPRLDTFEESNRAIGTNIEIDLSSGGLSERDIDAWERAKILEKTLRQQMEEEAQVVKNLKQGSTIELAPTDTLVFDLSSQNWGVRLDEVPVTACHTHNMGHLYADQPA